MRLKWNEGGSQSEEITNKERNQKGNKEERDETKMKKKCKGMTNKRYEIK